jgi:drug/metabolite transporter (DMT)-like permease
MATAAPLNSIAVGIACGAGAALFWAAGFTAAKHGIDIGMSPADLAFHRFFWSGVVLLPLVMRDGIADLNGIGWGRGIALTIFGGPGLAIISYSGFLLVPLGHGGVIQPSCAAVGGLFLAARVLKEKPPLSRIVGAGVIVGGLLVIGGEALATIGVHGLVGDLMFMIAGFFFATFGMLLRLWRMAPTRATVIVSAVSLGIIPVYWALHGFEQMLALGWRENLLQAVMQGILAGPGAIYLFARAVVLLGAGRAAVFPSLVPGFTLLIGFLALGIVPSLFQLLGFAIVLAGFRLTQKG